jgi:DNA-directed RNA polymerase subunit beta'
VWDALEEVIREHPVLLNRAPTLHRLGIQAFEPVLVEGKAIKIHPLVCAAFNADFDGDQMAVHVPLSPKAQVESQVLMLASNNIMSPANGRPLTVPSQDLVLGCYYLTKIKPGAKGEGKVFANFEDVELALQAGVGRAAQPDPRPLTGPLIDLTKQYNDQDIIHAEVTEVENKLIETTVGRVIFNMTFRTRFRTSTACSRRRGFRSSSTSASSRYGNELTVKMLDELKEVGFLYATKAGVSIGVEDMVIPAKKPEIVERARKSVLEVEKQRLDGAITAGERHNKIIDIWHRATEQSPMRCSPR